MTRPDRCPYGWRPDPADPAGLIEDAQEQAAIVRIREDRRQGMGFREIARASTKPASIAEAVAGRTPPCARLCFDLPGAEAN